MQDLVGVDVADPGEHLLIHERRLDAPRGPRRAARPARRGRSPGRPVRATARTLAPRLRRAANQQILPSRRVSQYQTVARGFVQVERQADVVGSLRLDEPKASSHPRLDDDNPPVDRRARSRPTFPDAPPRDRRPASPPLKLLRRAPLQQERVVNLEPPNRPTGQRRPEPSHHRLNFRKLRHRSSHLPESAPFYGDDRSNAIDSTEFRSFSSRSPSLFLKVLDKLRWILKNSDGL